MHTNRGLVGLTVAVAVLALHSPSSAQVAGAGIPRFVDDRVVLVLAESVPNFGDEFDLAALRAFADAELRGALDRFGAWRAYPVCRSGGVPIRNVRSFGELGLDRHFVVDFARGTNEELALAAFSACRGVESVRLDGLMQGGGQVTPNDPLFTQQWNLSQANDHDIDADFAWDITKGSPQVIVAVLDSGVDLTHPDLSGGLLPGWDFVNNDSDPQDDHGHGTSCAGIIGARAFNNRGAAGIAWHCSILPVRVLHNDIATGEAIGSWTDLADGVTYATNSGAHVISMSIWDDTNSGPDLGVSQALAYAAAQDSLCIAITGNANQGWISFPASDANCMAVGATSLCDERKSPTSCDGENWWGSNFGPQIDLVAPGVQIRTTALGGGYTNTFNGTSAAAPHVAGVAALVRSLDSALTAPQVQSILTSSAEDQFGPALEDTPGFDNYFGHGRLNAHRALLSITERGTTARVCVSSAGNQANGVSQYARISSDGRYVAFTSDASNLVAGDTNGASDTFVRDRQMDQTLRVSVSSSGIQGNGASYGSSISSDGRYVTFGSYATNLVSSDTNGLLDTFVRDLQAGQTTRVSVSSSGSQGNGYCGGSSISSDGRYVAFISEASNLVLGDTNGVRDVFVHDRQTGQTTRASVDSSGIQGNGLSAPSGFAFISSDGRYVVFESYATNLVPGDTNGFGDAFVHDQQTGQTTRASVDSLGNQGNGGGIWPSISANGRYVAFASGSSNLVSGDTNGVGDVFVRDRQTGQTTRVSVDSVADSANFHSYTPTISSSGRYVSFHSLASNLVIDDTNGVGDVFVHDRQTGVTTRVSVDSSGSEGTGASSYWSSISADGHFVAFDSVASNLVLGDTNGVGDVFVRDRTSSRLPAMYCSGKPNSAACMPSITWHGEASMTSATVFDVGASNVVSDKSGIFFFGLNGPNGAPFQGGTLCVAPPTIRTPIQSSGGTPGGGDCTGAYSLDFNALIQGGAYSGLASGASVCGQYWHRDPQSPSTTGLTDAIAFTVQP